MKTTTRLTLLLAASLAALTPAARAGDTQTTTDQSQTTTPDQPQPTPTDQPPPPPPPPPLSLPTESASPDSAGSDMAPPGAEAPHAPAGSGGGAQPPHAPPGSGDTPGGS